MTKLNLPKSILLLVFITCSLVFAQAQKSERLETHTEVTYAKKLGTTKAIRDMIPKDVSKKIKKDLAKKERYIPKNTTRRQINRVVRPEIEHTGEDQIRQKGFTKGIATTVIPSVNIDGLFAGGSPHDPTGDAGMNYYLQAVNATEIGVYSKQGEFIFKFYREYTLGWNGF